MSRAPSSKRGLILRWSFSVLFVLGLIGLSSWSVLDEVPDVQIPTSTLPNPNAYTYCVQASHLIKDEDKVREIGLQLCSPTGLKSSSTTLRQMKALLAENAPALQALRAGFAYPYRNPPIRSFDMLFVPSFIHALPLASLLNIEAEVKAQSGDWKGAMQTDLDTLRLGEDIVCGASIPGLMDSVMVKNFGQLHLSRVFPHLTLAQTRGCVSRLEAIRVRRVPWGETLQEEKWRMQASLIKIFHQPQWQQILLTANVNAPRDLKLAQIMFVPRATVLRNYTRYMDECIAAVSQPNASPLAPLPAAGDAFTQMLAPGTELHDRDIAVEISLGQMVLRAALSAYKRDHRAYPVTLGQLVPVYLSRLPVDPSAVSGTFIYTRDKKGYSLADQGSISLFSNKTGEF